MTLLIKFKNRNNPLIILLFLFFNLCWADDIQLSQIKSLEPPYSYSVILPDLKYVYFDHVEEFSFESDKSTFSAINAWYLSEVAFLTYADNDFIRDNIKKAGFNDVVFFDRNNSQAMILWNDTDIILSFRGTEINSVELLYDVITDIDSLPAKFPLGGKVHNGFLKAFNDLWLGYSGMESFLNKLCSENKDRSIWFTGHSMGAAMATLGFAYVPEANGLYTIGSPRVGDLSFKNIIKDRNIFRIVNNKDPFILTPPSLPMVNFYYADIGDLFLLDEFGIMYISNDNLSYSNDDVKLADKFGETDQSTLYSIQNLKSYSEYMLERYRLSNLNIFDHMPVYYSIKLWNNIIYQHNSGK